MRGRSPSCQLILRKCFCDLPTSLLTSCTQKSHKQLSVSLTKAPHIRPGCPPPGEATGTVLPDLVQSVYRPFLGPLQLKDRPDSG